MTYTMMFALSLGLEHVLLLQKPEDHHNPLFRGRWTAPGGHLESGETTLDGALREMREETGLHIQPSDARLILRFFCNCDPTEPEHDVVVYGAALPVDQLYLAVGSQEPVETFAVTRLPGNLLWYTVPLLNLVLARMRQPA